MKQDLEEILTVLLSLQHKDFTEIKFEDGKFSFKYGGAKFIMIKSMSVDLNTGYLTVYHETPFEGAKHFIEIENFEIKVTNDYYNGTSLKIKNHIDQSNTMYKRRVDDEGYTGTDIQELLKLFPAQLIAKLMNDKFRLYLM